MAWDTHDKAFRACQQVVRDERKSRANLDKHSLVQADLRLVDLETLVEGYDILREMRRDLQKMIPALLDFASRENWVNPPK